MWLANAIAIAAIFAVANVLAIHDWQTSAAFAGAIVIVTTVQTREERERRDDVGRD